MIKRIIIFPIFFIAFISHVSAFPVTVKDESGVRFTALSAPRRIISTMPNNTEILFDLGLGNKIIAVSSRCDHPPQAASLPKVGDITLSAEKIASLNPDLIVMLYDTQKYQIERLRALSMPVFVVNPRNFDQLADTIMLLGRVTGTSGTARELSKKIKRGVEKASARKRKGSPPKVLVVLWPSPLITAGRDTFIDDIIKRAGGVNIGASVRGAYPSLDFEFVLSQDPDYIVYAGKSYGTMQNMLSDRKWQQLKAVRDKKVILVDSDIITRPTPRAVRALELISGFLNE